MSMNPYRYEDPMSSFYDGSRRYRDVVSARVVRRVATVNDLDHELPFPPLSKDAICPKCASDSISMRYRPKGSHIERREGLNSDGEVVARLASLGHQHGEWMERFCDCCRFSWPESVAEATTTAARRAKRKEDPS